MKILNISPIDPYDCEDANMARNQYRFKRTIKLIDEIREPVLDAGAPNVFGKAIAEHFGIKDIHNTVGDLNFAHWLPSVYFKRADKYKTVFCFEVIEHLLSPAMFLNRLREFIDPDAVIYITYPVRPQFMWTHCHFHEYDRKRFLYLINYCGFRVEKYEWKWQRDYFSWWFWLTGVRPLLLRWNIGRTRRQYYKLRLK